MGYKDIKAGTYKAKPLAARLVKAKTGKLAIEVAFEFEIKNENNEPQMERLAWAGWLSPDAIERTMKTMVDVLGYNGDDEFKEGCIDLNANVELVVELEADQNDATKKYPRIRWVNGAMRSAFSNVEPTSVKAELAGLNFKAMFMAAKAGKKSSGPAPQIDEAKLPF